MDDLIRRRDAINAEAKRIYKVLSPYLTYKECFEDAKKTFKDIPPASPKEPKGEWIDDGSGYRHKCSRCGENALTYQCQEMNGQTWEDEYLTKRCPNCGADMRKQEQKAESIIETWVHERATREAEVYEEGMAKAWKIAQIVFHSDVTLYEAMDLAKCIRGADDK